MSAGPLANGDVPEDSAAVTNALLRAVRVAAENAAGDGRGAEAKDYAAAALSLAQAIVVLDPTRDQGGVPLAHHAALEQLRQDGMKALEQARQAAAAPTPRKRSVSISRDAHGRAQSYSVHE